LITPEPARTVADEFFARAQAHPGRLALAIARSGWTGGHGRYEEVSFGELEQDSNVLIQAFSHHGIGIGTRTLIMIPPGRAFAAALIALLRLRAPPVFIDPGIGLLRMRNCVRTAAPVAFVGTKKAAFARTLLGWGRDSIKISLTIESLKSAGVCHAESARYPGEARLTTEHPELAAVAFTSGSTGTPKGVAFSHTNLTDLTRSVGQLVGDGLSGAHLATFPFLMALAPALGLSAVIPVMDWSRPVTADPALLVRAIEDYGCESAFASPALVRKLAYFCNETDGRLGTMRRLLSAGAPSDPKVLAALEPRLAPDGEIYTPYGATEALPVSNLSSRDILRETAAQTRAGAGVCVGRTVPGLTARIITITDDPIEDWETVSPLPTGEVGEIAVCGGVVSPYYFADPNATALAKIPSRADNSFYHRMGDLGYFDEAGRLWLCGRKSERVITKSRVFFTLQAEGVFNDHPSVTRTALVGVPEPDDTEPVLCIELAPRKGRVKKRQIVEELREIGSRYGHTRSIREFLFHTAFPVDARHNTKIRREDLSVWAAKRLRRPGKRLAV